MSKDEMDPPGLDDDVDDDSHEGGGAPPGQLGDWADKYPQALVEAAQEYDEACAAFNEAKSVKSAKAEVVKELLHEHSMTFVVFRQGTKRLSLSTSETLSVKKTEAGDLSANQPDDDDDE